MKAITTKYIGPTDYCGSRLKASWSGGNCVTILYNSSLTEEENHFRAAKTLLRALSWGGKLTGEWTQNGRKWSIR